MVNINGKEWLSLEASDIQAVINDGDFAESFFFEFKDDKVSTKKLIEEVSAFANTFGGYIFIGVSDDKKIEGCSLWDEQRIHTTIHDSITPIPSFDIKQFTCSGKVVYVVKINEGDEPPYVTSSGKIYERLSSGSYTIKDSSKLSQIYNKREQLLLKMENKISIPPASQSINNIYGYIDIGFALVSSNLNEVHEIFYKANLKDVASELIGTTNTSNITIIGNSIFYIPGGLSTDNGQMPAHTNNFLEIMADGSAKMRILLINNTSDGSAINMLYARTILTNYQEVYASIMKKLFPKLMVYAKKYESLTVLKQFHPLVFYDESILAVHPDWKEENIKILDSIRSYRNIFGIDVVVTDDRIPKSGLYTIDKSQMEKWGSQYTTDSIINELFFSRFILLGSLTLLNN